MNRVGSLIYLFDSQPKNENLPITKGHYDLKKVKAKAKPVFDQWLADTNSALLGLLFAKRLV